MAIRPGAFVTACSAALLAGCSMMGWGGDDSEPERPAPLAAAPTAPVSSAPIPPPPAQPPIQDPAASGLAALDPAAQPAAPAQTGSVEVGRTDMLGGWTIASAGDSCQLFMTLTTWAGGYRASTRGCSSAPLQTISAWNLEGTQIQLLNDTGATVARLYPATKTQFNGQTDGGGPVSVSRS